MLEKSAGPAKWPGKKVIPRVVARGIARGIARVIARVVPFGSDFIYTNFRRGRDSDFTYTKNRRGRNRDFISSTQTLRGLIYEEIWIYIDILRSIPYPLLLTLFILTILKLFSGRC